MNAATVDEIDRMRTLAADMLLAADLLEGIAAQTATDGSGPPHPGPDPSPTFAVIVTLDEDLPAGSQLWVRRQWGALDVDHRVGRGSWGLGQYAGLTVEDAP